MSAGSNLGRRFSIGRLRAKGGDGGGGTYRSSLLRGGAARSSPDFAVSGHPEVKTTGIWVRENRRGIRDALAT